ncbi:nitrite reductase large subunit NirB [Halalkalibacterium halodurans]|uniref:Nitrite reductase n=1 Tax=Halalkalibacterium halodurans TaxID=86665 RepID=A0A0M0KBE2_ALKHA|nr:nitrite reductase large subunit NirB [Halalkalibacterium halodurans]TPE69970.1 NAD(P)/FAD-dependent oxidoreductase [Halalkalibacterium halodurans]
MKEKLVVVGNGMAGIRTVEELFERGGHERYEVTVVGEEPHVNYNRILLSSVLASEANMEDIELNSLDWYRENDVTLYRSEKVTKLDRKKKVVLTDKGQKIAYDKVILATGSHPFMLPLPGSDLEGVIAFRNIEDCETMIETAKNYKKAVVIGGGLLGIEAARGLLNLGMEVEVVHIFDYLMERQLDRTAANILRTELENQGMKFLLEKQTEAIIGKGRVERVKFKDGTETRADLVVMAVGIRPNHEVASASGIEVNRGIVVDDYMQTSDPDVYAVGECAEHRGMVYGLVAPLWEQGKILANALMDNKDEKYEGSVLYSKLKVSGVQVFSVGEFQEQDDAKSVSMLDEFAGIYKKIVTRGDKIVGSILVGDTSESTILLNQIIKGVPFEGSPMQLLRSHVGSADDGVSAVSMLSNEDQVCGCNGVSKGAIIDAIKTQGCASVADVGACTTAGRSCGTCKPMIADLLAEELGETANEKETMCGCTNLSHEEVVAAIREKGLTHTREVMNVLGWKEEHGCSKCRPAINYYLAMVHPLEHEDERESRFVNERLHANIQKDGTYSVVPRMYGGVTNPDELRRIADVAEKFNVPLLKITGGQRIDLLGVKKEDVPSVWKELDMPSGYAYGKALRTVKTCVGEDFCRFGTQDSIGLGIAIEKKFERLNTPHKVKMAVSACPRNCAESGIKDVGIVGVEGAWEIYVGGNGGASLRLGDLMCRVKTSEEVLEIIGAFLQLYREEARYLERTSHWVERVGLDYIKETLLEHPENRKVLNERMDEALSVLTDPWEEINNDPSLKETLFEEKVAVVTSE